MTGNKNWRRSKHPDLLARIKEYVNDGRYLDTRHAQKRREERHITRLEILDVLLSGHHEKRKDEFREEFRSWNYAIKGNTMDGRNLRVVVSFDDEVSMLIITAIDLDD